MLKVPLINARPGMLLAMPLFHPEIAGHTLLRPGFVLDQFALRRLHELKVGFLWVHYPELATALKYVNAELVAQHASVTSMVGQALDQLRDTPEHRFAELDFKPYVHAVRDLVGKIGASDGAMLLLHDLVAGETPLAIHSGNTCFLSLLLGLKLDQYLIAQRPKLPAASAVCVDNLGVSALLHDVGMARLAPEVVERWTVSGDDSDPAYQAHVRLGYDLLRPHVEPTAAAAVLQHHQRYDGLGFPRLRIREPFPRALRAEEIHVFARIIAVADWYDRLRNPPQGRMREDARRPVVRVLKRLLVEARAGAIDPFVFKGLVNVVPAFAPGTMVRLSDGREGVVSEFDPLAPCQPPVRALHPTGRGWAPDKTRLGEPIDLRAPGAPHIAEAEGQRVSDDLFTPIVPGEFDLRVGRIPATMGAVGIGFHAA